MAGVMYRNYEDPYSRNLGHKASRIQNGGFFDMSQSQDDDVSYDLDHLATYSMDPRRGLSNIDDAFGRLRRMALSSGIWTKRLKLRIGARDLVVIDGSEPIERFPLRQVNQPVANAVCEGYDNVVGFFVVGDELMHKPAEIHLFQVIGKPAVDLANDIKSAKLGKPLQKHVDDSPTYGKPTPDRLRENAYNIPGVHQLPELDNGYNRNAYYSPPKMAARQSTEVDSYRNQEPDFDGSIGSVSPLASTPRDSKQKQITDEEKAIDMKMLDLCFEDIEKFMTTLQLAAKDAADETKAADQRLQPPDVKDFFEIFQKFKMAFVILSRLKREIRDPSASELVHSLFGPLQTIIDSSRAGDDSEVGLVSQVTSPLLTAAAVDLLNNCLTSKEMDLLNTMGPAWITPRESWKKAIPPFILRFTNGTVANKEWLDMILEIPPDSTHSASPKNSTALAEVVVNASPDANGTNNLPRDAESLRRQNDFLIELQARGSKAYVVTKRRQTNHPKELSIEVEDVVEVLDDSKQWWHVRNCLGEMGYVPGNGLRKA